MLINKTNNKAREKETSKRSLALVIALLITILIILTSINLISSATSNLYSYNIELYYNKGNIDIKKIEIEFSQEELGGISDSNINDNYYLRISDSENKILDKIYFKVPNFILIDIANESGDFIEGRTEFLENVSFNVFATYYENGYQIIVYDKNNIELDREYVSQFSETGFNKEDFLEKGIEKGIGKVSDERDERETEGIRAYVTDYKNYIIILTIILIVLIIVLIYFLSGKK